MPIERVDYQFNPDEPMPAQTADWTCSACSLAWLNRAMGIQYATDEWSAVDYIGNPENINSAYGLMDGSGSELARCLRDQGVASTTVWPAWQQVYKLAQNMPLLLGGATWYHWVGCRTAYDDHLFIANSAIGWMGVGNTLSETQWYDLGPFAVVIAPLHILFPPQP